MRADKIVFCATDTNDWILENETRRLFTTAISTIAVGNVPINFLEKISADVSTGKKKTDRYDRKIEHIIAFIFISVLSIRPLYLLSIVFNVAIRKAFSTLHGLIREK